MSRNKKYEPEVIRPDTEPKPEEDPQTEAAVEDIEKHDSDELLKPEDDTEDSELSKAFKPKPAKSGSKLKQALANWWGNKKLRYATLAGVAGVVIILVLVPFTRYGILNAVGMRTNMSLTVLDDTTQLPLKDASVSVQGNNAQTNDNGVASFSHLKLGKQTVSVSKVAFASLSKQVTLGMGGNNLGNLPLKAVGTQYSFVVTDYLTGKPVAKAEATSGGSDAQADANGKIILTVNPSQTQTIPVSITSSGYRNEQVSVKLGTTSATPVQLVPNGKDVFVSQATGKYDVYTSDLDGKNRALLLAATGLEDSNITLVPSPDNKKVALIDKRDNVKDSDGYLLYTVVIIDIGNGSSVTIDHGESIQAIGWVGTRFVYELTVAGASAANSQRSKIISYNYANNSRVQLANADSFNAALEAQGAIYYAVSSLDPGTQAAFYRVNADGTNRQTILNQEVWTVLQRDYNTLDLQTSDGWLSYTMGSSKAPQATTSPTDYVSVSYLDSPDGSQSIWNDFRDGKGVLLLHDISSNKDVTVTSQSGLTTPFVWIGDNVVVYRVSSQQETADYVISTQGGSAHKITDVTNTFGAD